MKKLYIAGPISAHADGNRPAFAAEAARLRALGYEVVNPHEIVTGPTLGWAGCMREDIPHLLRCDGVALLPNWMKSKGARLEWSIAHSLGMQIEMASDIREAACSS